MNARDVIATASGINGTWSGKAKAGLILEALAHAGYTIIRDDETHAPTERRALERAAELVLAQPPINELGGRWRQKIAAAIRALIKDGEPNAE